MCWIWIWLSPRARPNRYHKKMALWVRSYFASKTKQCNSSIMKMRDDQITLRIAATLRAELEAEARADDSSLSGIVRRALIEFATNRITARAGTNAGEPRG